MNLSNGNELSLPGNLPAFTAYVDETYEAGRGVEAGFYALVATIVENSTKQELRRDLLDIVGRDYWHSTEALRDGKEDKFTQLLRFMHSKPTMNIYVVTTEVESPKRSSVEKARRIALESLLSSLGASVPNLHSVVIEKRPTNKQNNSDVSLFNRLKRENLINSRTAIRLDSPAQDRLLWLPDIAAMTFRRVLTHPHHYSSGWFGKYLEKFSHVSIANSSFDFETLDEWVTRMNAIQQDSKHADRSVQASTATGPLGFLQLQSQQLSIQQRIERELGMKLNSPLQVPVTMSPVQRVLMQLAQDSSESDSAQQDETPTNSQDSGYSSGSEL